MSNFLGNSLRLSGSNSIVLRQIERRARLIGGMMAARSSLRVGRAIVPTVN
ncbi:MAG TPA: hypothetical protein V6D18_19090 [Thermosynechococcaceae cyanobacterium]